MAVQAITREGRESLSILTAELKKGLPALEAELMARFDKKMEEAGESFSQALEEEKETIKNLTPPTAKQVSTLKGENTKLRKQIAELGARVDGMAAILGAGNVVGEEEGENTKLRKQIAALEGRVDGLVETYRAGNVGEDAPLSVASVNARVTNLRDVIGPWMTAQEALVHEHETLIQKLRVKYKRYLA